jgi:hypothetical protein
MWADQYRIALRMGTVLAKAHSIHIGQAPGPTYILPKSTPGARHPLGQENSEGTYPPHRTAALVRRCALADFALQFFVAWKTIAGYHAYESA